LRPKTQVAFSNNTLNLRITPAIISAEPAHVVFQNVMLGSFVFLPLAYADMYIIGVPVHVALKKRSPCHPFSYVAFGFGGGLVIGILMGSIAFPIAPIYCVICGTLFFVPFGT